MPGIPSSFNQQRRFIGLDVYHPAQDLDDGHVQQADNLLCQAGELVTRPGKQGLFTTPLSAPLYAPLPYIQASGATKVFFVSGGASNGQLYSTTKGSASYAAVAGTPTNIASAGAQLARIGGYGYLVDGVNPLVRFDVTNGATTLSGLTAPTGVPAATLTNTVIDAWTSTSGWVGDYIASSTNVITDPNFVAWAAAGGPNLTPSGTFWVPINDDGSIDLDFAYIDSTDPTTRYIRMDDHGDEFQTTAVIVNAARGNDASRYAKHFFVSATMWAVLVSDSVDVTVTAYSDVAGTLLIGQRSIKFSASSVRAAVQVQGVISFGDVATEIRSYKIGFRGGLASHAGPGSGPYISYLTCYPVEGNGATSTSGTTFAIGGGGHVTVDNRQTAFPSMAYLGNYWLTKSISSTDFSTRSHIAIGWKAIATYTGVSFKLGLYNGSSWAYTNPATLSTDGTYYGVDISNLTAAQRQTITSLALIFLTDLPISSSTGALFEIGPLTDAGNLSVGAADYTWVFAEVNSTGDSSLVNVIESDSSPTSNALTPSNLQAEASLVFAAKVNTATDYFYIYRYGGVFPQGDTYPTARLVAKVSYTADSSDTNGYWSWNHTTRTFTDNVPDSQLFYADTLITGRGTPPVGAQCLAAWQNRLCLAKGSTLYLSWLISESASNGLYFNAVNDPADPNLPIKGIQVSVGGADNDNIQALIPLGAMLIILKSRSVWMLTGNSGDNFQLSGHLQNAGVGCVAPRATALVGLSGQRVWMLSGDGVWEYDGGEIVQPRSLEIEPLIAPGVRNGTPIPAQYFSKAAMLYAGQRLYLFAPGTSADTANTVAYVFDTRQGGWTRFTGMNITSACTTATASDVGEIYLAGLDGQLYQLTGSGDKATPASSATAVSFAFTSRGFGQEAMGLSYFTTNIATTMYAAVQTGESASLTFTARASGTAATYARPFTVNGLKSLRFPSVTPDVRGDWVSVSVSGATVMQTKITSVAAQTAEGEPSS